MRFGRYYEEFEIGAVYRHWPGKTVTESDDHLFCLLTMNHHPLHIDAHYAQTSTEFGRNVVVGNLIYSLLIGMSVPDVSGRAIANLEIESLRHVAPTFHGDTLYGETTVLDKEESQSSADGSWCPRPSTPAVWRRPTPQASPAVSSRASPRRRDLARRGHRLRHSLLPSRQRWRDPRRST
jgi:acyl dehydratase